MTDALARLFAVIVNEAESNAGFRTRIAEALAAEPGSVLPARKMTPSRSRNRRTKAVIDPYHEYAISEENLRAKLSPLTVDQLKDVVSEHALDASRVALKWKNTERLVDLIVTTVRARVEKGDVFRRSGG